MIDDATELLALASGQPAALCREEVSRWVDKIVANTRERRPTRLGVTADFINRLVGKQETVSAILAVQEAAKIECALLAINTHVVKWCKETSSLEAGQVTESLLDLGGHEVRW